MTEFEPFPPKRVGPCVMCKGDESIAKGFSGESIVKHLLVGFAQGVQLADLVALLCSRHRRRYEMELEHKAKQAKR